MTETPGLLISDMMILIAGELFHTEAQIDDDPMTGAQSATPASSCQAPFFAPSAV